MRTCLALLATLAATAVLPAQLTNTGARDVGLTLQTGPSTSNTIGIIGQACGAFTCVPFRLPNSSPTLTSLARTARIYGDASSLYVLAASTAPLATPCVTVPGIGNALILGQPYSVISFGTIGPYLPGTSVACRQGVATYQFTVPPVAPAVVLFHLQAVTYSFTTQRPAFTVAVQGVAR